MTPVQQKVLTELPNFNADCLVQAKTGMWTDTLFSDHVAMLLPIQQHLRVLMSWLLLRQFLYLCAC